MKGLLVLSAYLSLLISNEPVWLSYNAAIKQAEGGCKPILLYVYNTECLACQRFDKQSSSHMALRHSLEQFVLAKMSSEQAIYAGASIRVTPTFFIVNYHREELVEPIQGLPVLAEYPQYLNQVYSKYQDVCNDKGKY